MGRRPGWELQWSRVATLPLIHAVLDAVHPTPVVAASRRPSSPSGQPEGDHHAVLASVESAAHRVYKRVALASETDTTYTNVFNLAWPDSTHWVLTNLDRPPLGGRRGSVPP